MTPKPIEDSPVGACVGGLIAGAALGGGAALLGYWTLAWCVLIGCAAFVGGRLLACRKRVLVEAVEAPVEVAATPALALAPTPVEPPRSAAVVERLGASVITLPEEEADEGDFGRAVANRLAAMDALEQGRPQVLIVDDNPTTLKVAIHLFEKAGCQVVAATSGEAAMDEYEPTRFALVIMDYRMPGLSGFEVTRVIRARDQEAGVRTPVLACTVDETEQTRQRCREAGMEDFLPKPLTREGVELAVERFVRHPEETHIAAEPTLDPSVLANYGFSMSESAEFAEFLRFFLEQAQERVDALWGALREDKLDELARLAHALKGNCGMTGAMRMMATCKALELKVKAGHREGVEVLIRQVQADLDRIGDRFVSIAD